MVNINLLPKWQVIPVKPIIFSLATFIIIIFLHSQCRIAILEKQEKINLLKKDIHNIESELSISSTKNKCFTASRRAKNIDVFLLLKQLPYTVPVGLYLAELSMAKNHCKLVGYAEKTTLISDLVTKLTLLRFDVSLQEMLMEKESDDFPIKFCLLVKPL